MCLMESSSFMKIPRKFFKVLVYVEPKNLFKAQDLKSEVVHYAVSADSLDAFFNTYPDKFEFDDFKFEFRVVGTFYSFIERSFYCLF